MKTDQRSKWRVGVAPYVERIWVDACISAKKAREQKQRADEAMRRAAFSQPERQEAPK